MTSTEKKDLVIMKIIKESCPSDFGLKDINSKRCKTGKNMCKKCWEAALKDDKINK